MQQAILTSLLVDCSDLPLLWLQLVLSQARSWHKGKDLYEALYTRQEILWGTKKREDQQRQVFYLYEARHPLLAQLGKKCPHVPSIQSEANAGSESQDALLW